jgi:putative aldouronate transport system substrate-binding protein
MNSEAIELKKTKKTLVCTVLLTFAATSVLAACGNGKQSASNTQSPGSSGKRGSISVMTYDRGQVPPEEGTYEKNRWTEWLNKNGPVDVKFVPIPRVKPEEKLNVLFASGSAPDLIIDYSADNRGAWYGSKQIQPIGDAIEKYSKNYKEQLNKYPILRKLGTRPDGKLYDIGFVIGKLDINWVYMVRADWLKKLNLAVPQTSEDLYKVAKAFTEQDPDGNGKRDTYGMGLGGWFNDKTVDFMFGNPIVGYHIPKDGTLVNAWDNLQAATEFKKRLFNEGIIDKDFAADTNGEKIKRDFVNGKVGVMASQSNDTKKLVEALMKNDPKAELISIALPKTQFGQFSPPIGTPAQVAGVVNAKAKDLESIVKYIDFINEEKTVKTMKWGIEGEHYTLTEKGCNKKTDLEKNKKERDYNDYALLGSQESYKQCDSSLDNLDPSKPSDVMYRSVVESGRKLYLSPDRPIPGYTSEAYVPALPADLKLILDSFNTDELKKSIVTADYSPEKAIQNLKDAWNKAGGGKIDEWYKNWYKDNKDKAILLKDVYEMK